MVVPLWIVNWIRLHPLSTDILLPNQVFQRSTEHISMNNSIYFIYVYYNSSGSYSIIFILSSWLHIRRINSNDWSILQQPINVRRTFTRNLYITIQFGRKICWKEGRNYLINNFLIHIFSLVHDVLVTLPYIWCTYSRSIDFSS